MQRRVSNAMKSPFLFAMTIELLAAGAIAGAAPELPLAGRRVVRVATEPELQAAVGALQAGDTILLADGVYHLTSSLRVNGRDDVTIRGQSGRTNVMLVGRGMNNRAHGDVPFGIWSNSRRTTVAHLGIRDTWDNEIILNRGAQAPHVYSVALLDAGSQFIKANPTDVAAGLGVDDGVVEYCWFEYTGHPPDDHGAGVGYFNGISAHGAKNWVVRDNVFKNLHNPDGTAYPWNAAVLFWRHSANTRTERNIFLNTDRAVAYGLENQVGYPDHQGGSMRNNFVCLTPGLFSARRKASADGTLIAWNSPGTEIDHNTVLVNGNSLFAVEFRFARTTNSAARNNLADAPVHWRDGASGRLSGNVTNAAASLFVNPAAGDLHLLPSPARTLRRVPSLGGFLDDIDGDPRPRDGLANPGADETIVR